ncbi:hypothetical protein AV530_009830 [Patagioenas fasciata monilis]|uniref:Uncharacterized protein n=1 Tax=Patagioenas fasciata monilis TaxID=372326 RepID=A0A1V4KAI8_PATFA|nr:hypothetical protein AV530_009830 [Patagioenas fasciata monilis]
MESLWVPMQELIPAGGRQRLDQFKPKLVEPMLEPPQGLVGKEQIGPGECLEEDKSKGVPGREAAHADEKVQAKEEGNVGMKSEEVLAGQGLGWRVANSMPLCAFKGWFANKLDEKLKEERFSPETRKGNGWFYSPDKKKDMKENDKPPMA